jgi:hypothetical protein
MADNTIQPSGLSLQSNTLDSIGQTGRDLALGQMKDIASSYTNDTPTNLINGQTITDLISKTSANQALNTSLQGGIDLNNSKKNNNHFDVFAAADKMNQEMLAAPPSFDFLKQSKGIGTGEDYSRYSQSGNFQAFGYTPGAGDRQEYKYGEAMTWGDTIGRAIGGGANLALETFEEGWKGWGRMTSALFNWDSSKLMGSEEERYDLSKQQEDIFNKYALYDTKDSKDSVWNRQFFGSMLQQSGFAIGAGLQFALESFLTAGVGTVFEGIGVASMGSNFIKASELINDTRKVSSELLRSERVTSSIANIAKEVVPLYGTIDEMLKLNKAGAGTLQLAMTGIGGVKRTLSEFNMARSEAIYEAASTYKQLQDKLVNNYIQENGKEPSSDDLEKIKQTAENASHDNFWVNMGVLSVMNRMQFDNMFKSFNSTRRIFNEGVHELENEAYKVSIKQGEKELEKAYAKHWFFGSLGAVPEISKDFGKKAAAWEATKILGKGLMKIEGSEGLQELIQSASDKGLEDYYYDLYHGSKGYGDTSLQKRLDKYDYIKSGFIDQVGSEEGLKTFLMGALTGALLSPGSKVIEHVNELRADSKGRKEDAEYQTRYQRAKENIALVNEWYTSDKAKFKNEWIANIKIQNKAALSMEEAAKNHNKYVFYNYKDSAFAKMVGSAIKLNMYDSVRDSIKELGDDIKTDEEFKQAFNMDPTKENRSNVKAFMNNIAGQLDEYYTTYSNLKDKYGDIVIPELYKNNDKETYNQIKLSKLAVDDAIEILTTNVHKAKQSVKRAVALQKELGENKNIGGSSIQILTRMGSEQAIKDSINTLTSEIKNLEQFDGTISKEQKELLKSKKIELELTNAWKDAHDSIMSNDEESFSPAVERRAYNTFKDLVNHFNEQSKLSTVLSKEDVDDNFIKFVDYIKLNKDNKAYVDAVNLLADPKNFKLVTASMKSAYEKVNEIFHKEHVEEIKKASGIPAEDLKEETKTTSKTPAATPGAVETKEEPTELVYDINHFKDFINEEYDNEKKENENFTLSKNEWIKSGAVNRHIAAYNMLHNAKYSSEDLEKKADKKTEAPVLEPKPEKKVIGKMLFDGKVGRIVEKNIISPADLANPDIEEKKSTFTYLDDEDKEHHVEMFLKKNEEGIYVPEDFVNADTGEIIDVQPYTPTQEQQKKEPVTKSETKESVLKEDTPTGERPSNEPYTAEGVVKDIDQPGLNKRSEIEKIAQEAEESTEHISRAKQVAPFNSLANATDLTTVVVDTNTNTQRYERGEVNKNYIGSVATSQFMPGAFVTYKVITNQDEPVVNRLTGETYNIKDNFDEKGKIKEDKYDKTPIGVYATFNGKEELIGHLHEPSWIETKKGDNYVHIAIPDDQKGMKVPTVVADQVEKNKQLRKKIISEFNKDPNFVFNAQVSDKSIGMIRLVNELGLLKDRVNPEIGKGGIENRHGMFGIVRGGNIHIDSETIGNVISTKAFSLENISKYEGIPVLLIPTPTGELFPSFIQIPRVAKDQAQFISRAWKAFTDKTTTDTEIVDAVYKAMGATYTEGDKPDVFMLKDYINAYITMLSAKSIIKLSNKNPNIPLGSARLNITKDGMLQFIAYLDSKKGVEKHYVSPGNNISSELETKFEKLLTTVKFSERGLSQGINSEKSITALSVKDGKLKVDTMPYNQYIMERASTFIDKGIPSKNNNNDWIYFANPVIKMDIINKPVEDITTFQQKEEVKSETPVTAESVSEAPKETAAQKLLAKLNAVKISDKEVEDAKDKCSGITQAMNDLEELS